MKIDHRRAWTVFTAIYTTGIVVIMCQFMVPPVMQHLIEELKIGMTTAGWLMSMFAVSGIVLAIPAAVLLRKLGPKLSGILALGCSTLGSIVGALADNASTMLIGRLIQGVGLGLISVLAPAVISMWFSPEKRGQPMGIWATWVPAGTFVIFNIASPLTNSFGWRGLWWFSGFLCLGCLVFYALVVDPPAEEKAVQGHSPGDDRISYKVALFNPSCWLLALVFAAFNFSFIGLLTWEPIFLDKAIGIVPAKASFDVSLIPLAFIPSSIVTGVILNRMKKRSLFLAAGMFIFGVGLIWCFNLPGQEMVVSYMLILGLLAGVTPTSVFTIAPEIVESPAFVGFALGIVIIGQNAGMMLGPPMLGSAIDSSGWSLGVTPMLVAMAIGVASSLFIKRG